MKTFFKRTAAMATGSVLALSQLATIGAINTNAADSMTLDKAWVVSVPIEEKALKAASFVDGDTVNEITEPVELGESKWNSDFETAILAIAGSGAQDTNVAVGGIKSALKTALAKVSFISDAQAQAMVDGIADNAVAEIDDEITTITLTCGEIGETVGEVIEGMMRETGAKMKDDLGNDVPLDWSAYKFSGKLIITLEYTYDKNIAYSVMIEDELGNQFAIDQFEAFAQRKITEAQNVVEANLKKYVLDNYGITVEDFELEMTEFLDYAQQKLNKVKKAANIVFEGGNISGYGASPQYAYDAYLESIKGNFGSRVDKLIDKKAPQTINAALANDKAAELLDGVLGSLGSLAGEGATIDISTADLADVLLSGYDYEISYSNIASVNAVYSIEDDQNAALLAALQAIDADVVAVESHKEITLDVATQKDLSGNLYFNVIRVIDKIEKKEVTTTSTTTTTTTTVSSTTTTTTTSSTTSSTTTTTTTEEPTSSSTTTTTTTEEPTSSSTTTTTTTEEPTSSSTTTTTTSSTSSSTTTTTTTTSSSSSTTTTTTTTEEPTSSSTTTTTTTEAPVYTVEFVANGGSFPLKYYWTEEDITFDFSDLKVMMNISKNGEQIAAVDVTSSFAPVQTKPSDFEYAAVGKYNVDIKVIDALAIRKAMMDAGVPVTTIDATGVVVGTSINVGSPSVFLTLRGDVNFDGKVDLADAQMALIYNAYVITSEMSIADAQAHHGAPEDLALLPAFHYAADVFNGNGVIQVYDAQAIMTWAGYNVVGGIEKSWDEITGKTVVVEAPLHLDPMAKLADENADAAAWYAEQIAQ